MRTVVGCGVLRSLDDGPPYVLVPASSTGQSDARMARSCLPCSTGALVKVPFGPVVPKLEGPVFGGFISKVGVMSVPEGRGRGGLGPNRTERMGGASSTGSGAVVESMETPPDAGGFCPFAIGSRTVGAGSVVAGRNVAAVAAAELDELTELTVELAADAATRAKIDSLGFAKALPKIRPLPNNAVDSFGGASFPFPRSSSVFWLEIQG